MVYLVHVVKALVQIALLGDIRRSIWLIVECLLFAVWAVLPLDLGPLASELRVQLLVPSPLILILHSRCHV